MKNTESEKSQISENEADNSKCGEKLIERINIDNTPFTAVKEKEKWFGVMGDYKMTEEYESFEEIKKMLEKPTWNIIIGVITAVVHLSNRMSNEKNK